MLNNAHILNTVYQNKLHYKLLVSNERTSLLQRNVNLNLIINLSMNYYKPDKIMLLVLKCKAFLKLDKWAGNCGICLTEVKCLCN